MAANKLTLATLADTFTILLIDSGRTVPARSPADKELIRAVMPSEQARSILGAKAPTPCSLTVVGASTVLGVRRTSGTVGGRSFPPDSDPPIVRRGRPPECGQGRRAQRHDPTPAIFPVGLASPGDPVGGSDGIRSIPAIHPGRTENESAARVE